MVAVAQLGWELLSHERDLATVLISTISDTTDFSLTFSLVMGVFTRAASLTVTWYSSLSKTGEWSFLSPSLT